jgi:hypothetical protein
MTSNVKKICAVNDAQQLNKLTRAPNYVCERCGAKGRAMDNVCAPVLIEPDH